MKNLKYLFIFVFVLSCGYTPIYQTDQILNIKLDNVNSSGDKDINREIVKNLDKINKCLKEIKYIKMPISPDLLGHSCNNTMQKSKRFI